VRRPHKVVDPVEVLGLAAKHSADLSRYGPLVFRSAVRHVIRLAAKTLGEQANGAHGVDILLFVQKFESYKHV
jgi:hypothetical protein